MITQIDISGFRSIKHQQIPLKKLNILYGPNGSGKSSVMYAAYVLRNFFVNPGQKMNTLFNLGFINLGSFDNISYNKEYSECSISVTSNEIFAKSTLVIDDVFGTEINYKVDEFESKLSIALPFVASERKEVVLGDEKFLWNGLTFERFDKKNSSIKYYTHQLNSIYEETKSIEAISVRRGFFSPIFSTEMEGNDESKFALQVREEGLDFDIKIDKYFNKIFDKNFRFVGVPGSNSFYLRTHNQKGFSTDLVNEGFGVNQSVYMLIKLLKKSTSLAFIEEPEIHLHPTAQGKLIDVFTGIIKNEGKQIFLTTHSENIVSSVLSKISSGDLDKDDVQFYLAVKENDETKIVPQDVNEKGQIEGGLMNFMENELVNLKALLGI